MDRRSFLINSSIASTALYFPKFLNFGLKENLGPSQKKLVVIQLSGGNDGLNTIVPYTDDIYYKSRPSLSIHNSEVLSIHDHFGLNPALEALRSLYDNGEWTIVNNVGYPNPDRSHFRSMDIWHTASGSDKYMSTGWLGRYLDHKCNGKGDAHKALEINDKLSLALKGKEKNGFVMKDAKTLKNSLENPFLNFDNHSKNGNQNLDYLYKVLSDTKQSADYLYEKSRIYKSKVDYPLNPFSKSLKSVAELINSGNNSSIYYLSLGSFDTHVFQNATQKRLLKTYADSVSAFVKDLKENDKMDDVLIMTFSEFGRRVKQNASNGTDHGTANNVFLMGTNLKKQGIIGDQINLEDLDEGDLKYKIDFRNIYSDILNGWLDTDSRMVVSDFMGLGLV